jgi:hypothetical protein
MEAALHNLRPAAVRLAGDSVVADNLLVSDETAVRQARERIERDEDAAAFLIDAIEIGARVLDREQAGANVDVVRAEMEKAAKGIGTELAGKLEEAFGPESGTFTRALERHFSDDSSGAVQHRVREVVAEAMAKMREDLLRQFSSP